MTVEELEQKILSIKDTNEMEQFIIDNFDDIYNYLCRLRKSNEVSSHIVSIASSDFIDEMLMVFARDYDDAYITITFLYDIYKKDKELFDSLITKESEIVKGFYNNNKDKEDLLDIMRGLPDKAKTLFFLRMYNIDVYTCFANKKELIDFIKRIPIEDACKLFTMFNLHIQKTIIMSDLDEELIRTLLKNCYYEVTKKEEQDIKDFVFDALMSTYTQNHKTGLLLLLNLISQFKNFEAKLEYGEFEEEAAFKREFNIFSHGKSFSLVIPQSLIVSSGKSAFFHELGHYMFKLMDEKHPPEYDSSLEDAKNNIRSSSNQRVNDFQVNINEVAEILKAKFNDKSIREALLKILLLYIKNVLKQNIIDYMKRNNYDESLINTIEENMNNFSIDELSSIALDGEIDSTVHKMLTALMGEYFSYEDLINSLFGGGTGYLDPSRVHRTTAHSISYYQGDHNLQFNEGFANFTSISLRGNAELLNLLRDLLGEEMFTAFEGKYQEAALYGIPEDDIELRTQIAENLHYDAGISLDKITAKVKGLSVEDIVNKIIELGARLFSEPKRTSPNFVTDYKSPPDFLDAFTSNPYNLPEEELLEQRMFIYVTLSSEDKYKVIKLKELDIDSKISLLKRDAKAHFDKNEKELGAVNSLLNKLFAINTDLISVFKILETLIAAKKSNKDFSLYDAIYEEGRTKRGI